MSRVQELDKPFHGLEGVALANITLVVAAFTGLNIFDRNTFEDCGPFQFCEPQLHTAVVLYCYVFLHDILLSLVCGALLSLRG